MFSIRHTFLPGFTKFSLNRFAKTSKKYHTQQLCLNHYYIPNKKCWNVAHASVQPSVSVIPFRAIQLSTHLLDEVEIEDVVKKPIDPAKDRSKVIPPETSIRYLESKAYFTTYGDEPVWVKYRRNFKGQIEPRKTRESCIKENVITTGNPCPICRDEYLVLHYTNVKLLKQFISPYTGNLYELTKIQLCLKKLFELEIAVNKAKFYGLLTYQVPFREFDYREYYPQLRETPLLDN